MEETISMFAIFLIAAFFVGVFLLVGACAASLLGSTVAGVAVALFVVIGMASAAIKGN